ncbi:MAG: hypothetical protein ACXWBN_14145, partial [Acidimicrobiales bacterium]
MTGDGNRVSTPDERPDPGELRREAGVLLDQSFEGILIGWQEVPGLADTATAKLMGPRLEALTQIGVDLMVVTTGSIGAVVGDLGARAFGPGHVWISDGRGKICSVEATGLHAVPSGSLIGAPAGRGARDRLLGALRDRGFGERLAIVVGQDQTPRGSSTM